MVNLRLNMTTNMVTLNYQAKTDTLLGYLSSHGYSGHYVSLFRNECKRIVEYFSEFGTLEGYLQACGKKTGTVLPPYRERVVRVILCYFENGRKPSRQHPMRRFLHSCFTASGLGVPFQT